MFATHGRELFFDSSDPLHISSGFFMKIYLKKNFSSQIVYINYESKVEKF